MKRNFNDNCQVINLPAFVLRGETTPENVHAWQKEQRKKRKMKNKTTCLILLLILPCLCVSCVTRKACERKFPLIDSDSTIVISNTVTRYKDTTVYIEIRGDTLTSKVPLSDVSRLNTTMALSKAWIENGKLKHCLIQKDTIIPKHLDNVIKSNTIEVTKKDVIIRNVNKVSSLDSIQIWIGRVFICYLLFYISRIIVPYFKS